MNENELEQLGRKLWQAHGRGAETPPPSLRAQIRAASAGAPMWPSRLSLAAAMVCVALLIGMALWQMPRQGQRIVTGTPGNATIVARADEAPQSALLLLDAATEWEQENPWLAVEMYREACATATHPEIAWYAASEVNRLEEDGF